MFSWVWHEGLDFAERPQSRFFTRVILLPIVVASSLALTAMAKTSAGNVDINALTKQGRVHLGYCHMGACDFFIVANRRTVGVNREGRLIAADLLDGELGLGDGEDNPTSYSRKMNVEWNSALEEKYYFCSPHLPTAMFRDENNVVQAHVFNFNQLGGYETDEAVVYARICHNVDLNDDPDETRFVKRFGYTKAPYATDIKLKSENEILDIAQKLSVRR